MLRPFLAALLLSVLVPTLRADATVALPLANTAKERSLDWIGESVAETILESLHSEGLVIFDRADRTEACQRLGLQSHVPLSRASIVKIADELDASHAVYGTFTIVRPPEGKPVLRLLTRVLDLKNLRQSAALTEEGPLDDLATLQNKLAWKNLSAIVPQRAGAENEFLLRRPKIRVDAMENYIRGLMSADASTRHRLFTQAARLDPDFSQPAFQLGLHYWDKEDYQQASSWFRRVSPRDAHYSESTYYFGICRHYLGQYADAELAFLTVASKVPLNEVFSNLGISQLRAGKVDRAIENIEKALEGDPADPDFHFNMAYALWHAKRYDEAADRFRSVLERIPDDQQATALLGLCLKRDPPRPGDTKYEGLERMKEEYQETVFRQLKSMIEKK